MGCGPGVGEEKGYIRGFSAQGISQYVSFAHIVGALKEIMFDVFYLVATVGAVGCIRLFDSVQVVVEGAVFGAQPNEI